MKHTRWLAGCLVLSAAACSARSATPAPPDPAATWNGDTVVARVLRAPVLGLPQMAAADTLASLHDDFDERLARVAVDSAAPPLIRTNAVLLLSDRRVPNLDVYLDVLSASDERVRAAGIVALRPFLNRWTSALGLVKKALDDSSTIVQTKALETLGDEHVDDLRAYTKRARNADLRKIAEDLIRTGEERGAPLVADSAGVLRRTTMTGQQISFRPTKRWDNWGVALGELQLGLPNKQPVRISDSVEVVRNVVPAFVSADGKYLIYEANRVIHVRDLATGSDRIAGSGIAPRLLPFTESFVYLRPAPAEKGQIANTIRYDVVQVPLAEGQGGALGQLTVTVKQEVNGQASPARWMRVRESEGKFQLSGDTMQPFALPDPFSTTK